MVNSLAALASRIGAASRSSVNKRDPVMGLVSLYSDMHHRYFGQHYLKSGRFFHKSKAYVHFRRMLTIIEALRAEPKKYLQAQFTYRRVKPYPRSLYGPVSVSIYQRYMQSREDRYFLSEDRDEMERDSLEVVLDGALRVHEVFHSSGVLQAEADLIGVLSPYYLVLLAGIRRGCRSRPELTEAFQVYEDDDSGIGRVIRRWAKSNRTRIPTSSGSTSSLPTLPRPSPRLLCRTRQRSLGTVLP